MVISRWIRASLIAVPRVLIMVPSATRRAAEPGRGQRRVASLAVASLLVCWKEFGRRRKRNGGRRTPLRRANLLFQRITTATVVGSTLSECFLKKVVFKVTSGNRSTGRVVRCCCFLSTRLDDRGRLLVSFQRELEDYEGR